MRRNDDGIVFVTITEMTHDYNAPKSFCGLYLEESDLGSAAEYVKNHLQKNYTNNLLP